MATIKELSKHTGLSIAYIRKCVVSLETVLKPHIQRGKHNALLFDSNGLVVFDRIKQLKGEGLSLPEIEKALTEQVQGSSKTEEQTTGKGSETTEQTTALLERLFDLQRQLNEEKDKHRETLESKDKIILDLSRKNEALEGTVKALPRPEDIEKRDKELHEKEQVLSQVETKVQTADKLVNKLEKMTGLLKGKQRKRLIEELKQLFEDSKSDE